jgi:formylmethanofuran dehydrogenase subunit E
MLILDNVGLGWKKKFEDRINKVFKLFSDSKIISYGRENALLKIKIIAVDEEYQDIIDSVTYKIERESARTCEECGGYGRRWEEHLLEKKCLCWKCYALEVDALMQIETQTESD